MKAIEARLCPIIDSPCSTPPTFARGQVSAFCSGCQKTVYNLSAMTAPAQTQLLTANDSLCVRYRKILPAAAFALAVSSVANSGEAIVPPPPVGEEAMQEVYVGGGVSRSLEPLFLESELDQSLDEFDAQELDNGAKQ
jgi:hypothetical protein